MSTSIIHTKQLRKSYATDGHETHILSDVDLDIQAGEYTIIMGSSGSGKSTLLYLLSGLDRASSGEVWLGQHAIHQQSEKALALLRRKELGFVFQSAHLIPNLSILENILVSGMLASKDKPAVRQRALHLLQKAGLAGLENRFPAQLSGGQQQRAAIIRGLINQPKVLLADEPTGNLNSASSTAILDLLSDFHREGQTILMVTHDLKTACRGSRILYFRDGKILAELHFDPALRSNEAKEKVLSNWLLEKGW